MTEYSQRSPVRWTTSSYSANGGGQCVEVGVDTTRMALRDSVHPENAELPLSRSAWTAFCAAAAREAL